MIKTVEWTDEGVRMIDQRLLPTEEKYLMLRSCDEVAEAIKLMVVRGAPAIGVSAAMGIALGTMQAAVSSVADLEEDFDYFCEMMSRTRPTAVNLFWAIERMRQRFRREREAGGYGTALGVVRGARDMGKRVAVIADETRPFLQGARLTAWELHKDDIPVTVITDNMAGHVMKGGQVDAVVVGADRIAANGDTANKIGTYMVAVLAREHGVPFYVAAPLTTLDLSLASGEEIPIEERDSMEITHIRNHQLAPDGVQVHNPAFDVTPNQLITAIITDAGVARPPFAESLKMLFEGRG